MHLLYTDETNIDPRSGDFFIYGGVAVNSQTAATLSSEIDRLRQEYGYFPTDSLKHNTKERPPQVTPEQHAEIKRRVMEVAVRHDVKLFTSFILHRVATSPANARKNEINRISLHFNYFLRSINDNGIILVDTFEGPGLRTLLMEKFHIGIVGLPYTQVMRLDRILGFHIATNGASNFSSLTDIVIGSMRYAINNRRDPTKQATIRAILTGISPMYQRQDWAPHKVKETSLFFSPRVVTHPPYFDEYVGVHTFLTEHGIHPAQEISQVRNY